MGTYILWDIDGTLISNTTSAGSLYVDAIAAITGAVPTEPVPNPHGMTEGQLLTAILEVNGHDRSRLAEVLVELDRLSLARHEGGDERHACPGTTEAIAAFADLGWTNALLTGNGPNRSRWKLLAAGYDLELFDWQHSYFGHEQPTRQHLTAGARDALAEQLRETSAVLVIDDFESGLDAATATIARAVGS